MRLNPFSINLKSLLLILFFLSTSGFVHAEQSSITKSAPLKRIDIGAVKLAARIIPGKGAPILFIHGSWDDHHGWLPVAERINQKRNNQIILYDRRGHSASTDTPGQGHISEDVSDAAALIKKIHSGPVHVIGHSYGANIAVSLANKHPELVAGLLLYEPPIFGVLKTKKEYSGLLKKMKASMIHAKNLMEKGEIEKGAIIFMHQVSFGKNSWYGLFDERTRNCMLSNADTWLDQSRDKERLFVNAAELRNFKKPVTLIYGDSSLPVFKAVTMEIKKLVPAVNIKQCKGAGHGGPVSHPHQVSVFIDNHIKIIENQQHH